MKGVYTGCLFFFISCTIVFGQVNGDYRSRQTGNWNTVTTWQVFNAAAWNNLEDAGAGAFQNVIPSSSSGLITVITGHAVTVPSSFSATANSVTVTSAANTTLIVASGGTLAFNGVMTLGSGPSGRGTLQVSGTFQVNQGATMAGGLTGSRITINSTGIYRHNYTTGSGQIYTSQWNSGSTLEISGYTSNATEPTGLNQSFQNVTWNCASQVADIYFSGLNFTTVLGNLSIQNSNNFVVGLTTTNNTTLTIEGNLSIGVNSFLDLTGGTATGAINLKGNFTMSGDDGIGNFGSSTATLTFNGTSVQDYISTNAIASSVNIAIANSSTLRVSSTNFISTLGTFTLNASATLQVGSTDASGAIQLGTTAGNIRVPNANRTYNSSANIVYNGSALQRLGNGFPSNVNLEIANASGVTNNNIGTTNVIGNLTLTTGSLNIGSSNTLNIQSNFFTTVNGSIGGDATSNLTFSGSGTLNTLRFSSGTESLNNLTVSRIADLVLGSNLAASGTIDLSGGNLDFSGQTLTMNGGSIITNATGLKSSSTSNLTFGGSTFSGSIPFSGSGNQLNNLTFGTNGGAYTWNSVVTVNNSVSLTAGTLTHTSGLTMADNSTFTKGAGSLGGGSVALVAVTSYNVTYNGTGSTGVELPSSSTALRNLTISSSGTITLASGITVNGILTLSGGTFAAGSNTIDFKGNFVSNAGSTLTSSTITFSGTTTISGSSTPTFGAITISGTLTPSSNFQINGNLTNNGTLNAGSGTTTFGGTTTISGSSTSSFNNVTISGTLTAPTGNFNVAATWTNNGTFSAGAASNTVTFNGTSSIAGSSTTNFSGITISGTLNAPTTLNVAGNFTNNGTFNRGTGTVVLNGSSTQSISGSATTDFNNISVTNTAGPPAVQIQSNQNLRGTLTLSSNAIFDADGSSGTSVFTLISTADSPTSDAGIATLPSGASVTGSVTVQRYMAIEGSGSRMYRYISSPVQTPAVSQIQTEIPITGAFTGASSCSGCGTGQSMFQYDETVTTGDVNSGYINFPSTANTETLTAGRGYTIYARGNIDPVLSAGSARWDVRAPINSGTVSFPATFTSSGTPANDGWNLVGNPYPSTIDWDAASGWTRTNVNNAIYMRDNAAGVVASYVGGVPNNGGSRYIPMGQGFFVQSTASPTFSCTESVKAAGTQSTFFREESIKDILRITLKQGNARDESVVRFTEHATDEFDGNWDAHKLKNGIFNLASVTANNLKLSINSLPKLSCGTTVNLGISDITPGGYQIEFTEFESFSDAVEIYLQDLYTNSKVNAREISSYAFEVTSDPLSFEKRFNVSFSYTKPVEVQVNASTQVCQGQQAMISIENSEIHVTYSVYRNGSAITEAIYGNSGSLQIPLNASFLSGGDNEFILHYSPANCNAMLVKKAIKIKSFDILSVTPKAASHCRGGSVSLSATGAEEGSYRWYETADATAPIEDQTGAEFITPTLNKTATYYVSAINALGCEGERVAVEAEIINYDDVLITIDGQKLVSNYTSGNQWYLNGELIMDATGQTLEVKSSGLYWVEVNVEGCTTRAAQEMIVTEIEEGSGSRGIKLYPNPVEDYLAIELPTNLPAKGEVRTSLGQVIGIIKFKPISDRMKGEFSFQNHVPGLYLLSITQGNLITTHKIIKK